MCLRQTSAVHIFFIISICHNSSINVATQINNFLLASNLLFGSHFHHTLRYSAARNGRSQTAVRPARGLVAFAGKIKRTRTPLIRIIIFHNG